MNDNVVEELLHHANFYNEKKFHQHISLKVLDYYYRPALKNSPYWFQFVSNKKSQYYGKCEFDHTQLCGNIGSKKKYMKQSLDIVFVLNALVKRNLLK